MQTILVVDDDPHIREIICFALNQAGFTTVEAGDGEQALARFASAQPRPALVVLDILMPELDGTEVCRKLRQDNNATPIIFLSSKDDEIDRIVGLELGGDDYLTKPFSPRELVARVKAILRRAGGSATPTPGSTPERHQLRRGPLSIDINTYKAYWGQHEVGLTVTEFGILRTLLEQPDRVLSRDRLMDGAYELNRVVSDRTIDSHVRRIRAKFAAVMDGASDTLIITVHGVGYRLGLEQ